MLEFAKLQWRKSRLIALGVGLALAASLVLPVPLCWFMPLSPSDLWGAVLLFWALAGVPLAALILSCAMGASLRADVDSGVETALPLSPQRRLAGALLAASAWTALLAGVVITLGLCCGSWRESLLSFATSMLGPNNGITFDRVVGMHERWFGPFGKPFLVEALQDWHSYPLGPAALIWACGVAFILPSGLAAAFALGGAVIGAVPTLVLTAFAAGGPAAGLWLQASGDSRSLFFAPIFWSCAAGVAGAGAAAWAVAACVERRRRWGGAPLAVLIAGILTPLLAGPYAIWRPYQLSVGHLTFLENVGRDRFPAPGGALASDKAGNIWWFPAAGGRTLLLAGSPRAEDGKQAEVSAEWTGRGGFWLLRHLGGGHYQLFTGDLSGPLTLHASLQLRHPLAFVRRGVDLGLETYLFRNHHEYTYWSPMTAGPDPLWTVSDDGNKARIEADFKDGVSARFSEDGRALLYTDSDKSIRCPLPGPAFKEKDPYDPFPEKADAFVHPPRTFWLGDGSPLFLAGIRTAKGEGIAACGPDGKARLLFDDVKSSRAELSGDGTLTFRGKDDAFLIVDLSGMPLPRLQLPDNGFNTVVHVEGGKVWMRREHWNLRVYDAATGEESQSWNLPRVDSGVDTFAEKELQDTSAGLFMLTGRRLYFVDWDGKIRDLGPA